MNTSPGRPDTTRETAGAILETVPALMRAIRAQMREGRAAGLSVPQFRTLLYLRRNPGSDLSSVAEHLGASLPAASEMISRLVRDGLATRVQDPASRRRVRLGLSPEGEQALAESRERTLDWLSACLADEPPEELARIEAALLGLRARLEESDPER